MAKAKKTKEPAGKVEAEDLLSKAKDEESEDESEGEDKEESDEDEDEEMEKGAIALADLEKGLKELEGVGAGQKSRKEELLEKAKSTALSGDEKAELFRAIEGVSLSKALVEDDEIQKSLDDSPAFDRLASAVAEAVDRLDSDLQKSLSGQATYNAASAKALIAVGGMIRQMHEQQKALRETLEKALDMPARAPRAPAHGASDKVETKAAAQAQKVSPRSLVPVLERMALDSMKSGARGLSVSGLRIKDELTKALAGQSVDPRIIRDAAEFTKAHA